MNGSFNHCFIQKQSFMNETTQYCSMHKCHDLSGRDVERGDKEMLNIDFNKPNPRNTNRNL